VGGQFYAPAILPSWKGARPLPNFERVCGPVKDAVEERKIRFVDLAAPRLV